MIEQTPTFNVALNTWLLLYINNVDPAARTFGGLPNDFLVHGAASLLVLDHIICDDDGLSTEAAMPWVSSHIFKALRAENLLRPRRFREGYSNTVLSHLREAGLLEWARHAMRAELARIKEGDVATKDLELPSTLRWLNSVMFTGIDLPNTLHYDYHENHFSNLSLAASGITRTVAPSIKEAVDAEDQAVRATRLFAALSIALPDFQLLPPIIGAPARAALRENITQEKRMMYRYVYGDFSHPEYERFRKGTDFTRRDAIVDSSWRFRQADANMDLLLRIRSRTADVRPHAQRAIAEVVKGARSLEDVANELLMFRTAVEEAIAHESKPQTLRIIAGGRVLLGAIQGLTAIITMHAAGFLEAGREFIEAAHAWREAMVVKKSQETLGRQHPLAWIAVIREQETARSKRSAHRDSKRPSKSKK